MRLLRWIVRVTAFRLALWIGVVTAVVHPLAPQDVISQNPVISRLGPLLYDAKFVLRAPMQVTDAEKRAKHVVIAAGDEKTIAAFGRWPWDRADVHARLIDRLVADGAAAVAFDASFSDEVKTRGLPELRAL